MMNGISFNAPGVEFIPLVGFNGDLFSQERARLGTREAAFFEFRPNIGLRSRSIVAGDIDFRALMTRKKLF